MSNNILYVTITHFHIFIVGDDLGGESVVTDDGLILDAGEDDAALAAGGARACGGCRGAAATDARRRHCYSRARARCARTARDITISHHTPTFHHTQHTMPHNNSHSREHRLPKNKSLKRNV